MQARTYTAIAHHLSVAVHLRILGSWRSQYQAGRMSYESKIRTQELHHFTNVRFLTQPELQADSGSEILVNDDSDVHYFLALLPAMQ